MGKFTVFVKFQAIAAITLVAASAVFAFPSFSQEANTGKKPISVETVESNSNQKEEPNKIVTTKNTQLPIAQLELLLKPYTKHNSI